MYNNKYNDKVVNDIMKNNKRYVEESKKMEDQPLTGGFLPFLASALLPSLLPSFVKAVGGMKHSNCECDDVGSGGSGFGPDTFMDTGFPLSGSGMSAGVKKYKKKVPSVGCGAGLDTRVIGGKKKRGRPTKVKNVNMEGAGFWSDFGEGFTKGFTKTLEVGLPLLKLATGGKKKRGRPAKGGMKQSFPANKMPLDEFKEEFKPVLYQGKGKKTARALIPNEQMKSSNMSGGKSKKVNKRAEVVKKVMKERGISMIEASKAVKAEGLTK
jgi:hypothetical protein